MRVEGAAEQGVAAAVHLAPDDRHEVDGSKGACRAQPWSLVPAPVRAAAKAAALELSPADLERITALDQGCRLVDGSFWLMAGSPWTLQALWDEG